MNSKSNGFKSLRDMFLDNEETQNLFAEIASTSINLVDITEMYDVTKIYYRYDNGMFCEQREESPMVDEKTVENINKIRAIIPDISISMRPINSRICVFFTIVKKNNGCNGGYYQEELIYSLYELPEANYSKISERWYFHKIGLQ